MKPIENDDEFELDLLAKNILMQERYKIAGVNLKLTDQANKAKLEEVEKDREALAELARIESELNL